MRIKKIEDAIIENKLKEALEDLREIFEEIKEDELYNEVLLLLSRLNSFESNSRQGTIAQFDEEINKMRLSILKLKQQAKNILDQSFDSEDLDDTNILKNKIEDAHELDIIFEDYFEDNSNEWVLGERKDNEGYVYGIYNILNNRYFLERKREKAGTLTVLYHKIKINVRRDFEIEVKMSFIKGVEKSYYGIKWGRGKDTSAFAFVVSEHGEFTIKSNLDGSKFSIKDWTASKHINKGRTFNVLKIQKKENSYIFYVNNEVVYVGTFHNFYGSGLGFCLGRQIKVAVEYLRIKN